MKSHKCIPFWLLIVLLQPSVPVLGATVSIDTLRSTQLPGSLTGIQIKARKSIQPMSDFDQRFCFIEKNPVNVWGYRIGVVINGRYKAGVGGYFFQQQKTFSFTDKSKITEGSLTRKAGYGTVFLEPYLFRKKFWELSTILEAGLGNIATDSLIKNNDADIPSNSRQTIMPVGMGLSVNLLLPDIKGMRFLSYFGLNGMIGMKKSLGASASSVPLDGWYWSVSSALFIDRICKDIKRNRKRQAAIY